MPLGPADVERERTGMVEENMADAGASDVEAANQTLVEDVPSVGPGHEAQAAESTRGPGKGPPGPLGADPQPIERHDTGPGALVGRGLRGGRRRAGHVHPTL